MSPGQAPSSEKLRTSNFQKVDSISIDVAKGVEIVVQSSKRSGVTIVKSNVARSEKDGNCLKITSDLDVKGQLQIETQYGIPIRLERKRFKDERTPVVILEDEPFE